MRWQLRDKLVKTKNFVLKKRTVCQKRKEYLKKDMCNDVEDKNKKKGNNLSYRIRTLMRG